MEEIMRINSDRNEIQGLTKPDKNSSSNSKGVKKIDLDESDVFDLELRVESARMQQLSLDPSQYCGSDDNCTGCGCNTVCSSC